MDSRLPAVLPDTDTILILDGHGESRDATRRSIAGEFPSARIDAVESVSALRSRTERSRVDIVVLDHAAPDGSPAELLHELRMSEHEPSVLVVSSSENPRAIAEFYNNGCQRFIVKEGEWRPELGSVIRQTLRHRKIQEQNRSLQARLIEANILLEEKNKRLDEFTATVAHDIRGPLSGLSMKLDFILGHYAGKFDVRCEQLLLNGMHSISRLNAMVLGMYDYAKLGSQAARMEPVNMNALVRELLADVPFGAATFEIGELPEIWGSADLLRRLFLNLFSNAVKFNDAPVPEIRVSCARPTQGTFGEMFEFSVEDNGRGIPEHEREHIFGMFQRGSSARGDSDGHGIGLAVVQRIVELHFGKVRAVPAESSGTRFIFTLPMRRVDLAG